MRLAPAYDSHDLADATRRDGFSDPRFRASSPTTHRAAASSGHGRRRLSAGKSNSPATYRKDGSSESLRDLSRVHELRDRQDLDRGRVFARQIGARHRGVGRPEIDPDAVSCFSQPYVFLRQLDFGRCDDGAARHAERRKLDAGRAPARVEERATERRLPGHVPDEVEGRRDRSADPVRP